MCLLQRKESEISEIEEHPDRGDEHRLTDEKIEL